MVVLKKWGILGFDFFSHQTLHIIHGIFKREKISHFPIPMKVSRFLAKISCGRFQFGFFHLRFQF